jgi:hypothetical protein
VDSLNVVAAAAVACYALMRGSADQAGARRRSAPAQRTGPRRLSAGGS